MQMSAQATVLWSLTDRSGVGRPLRVLDITKFYSWPSGGIRPYLDAKVRDLAEREVSNRT